MESNETSRVLHTVYDMIAKFEKEHSKLVDNYHNFKQDLHEDENDLAERQRQILG